MLTGVIEVLLKEFSALGICHVRNENKGNWDEPTFAKTSGIVTKDRGKISQ